MSEPMVPQSQYDYVYEKYKRAIAARDLVQRLAKDNADDAEEWRCRARTDEKAIAVLASLLVAAVALAMVLGVAIVL